MANIVTVSVTQQVASAPSTLQRTGAMVSQGATILTTGSTQLITKVADLTAILTPSNPITSMVLATGTVTVTTTNAHGIPIGTTISGSISGVVPTAYNGVFQVTSTGTNTFTYPLSGSPGAVTTEGVYVNEAVLDLTAMANTYFAQSNPVAVYVLELGTGTGSGGNTSLTAYINSPTIQFYSYLLTTEMSSATNFVTMATSFESTSSQVYFYATVSDFSSFSTWAGIKSIIATYESPTAPVTQWDAAAVFATTLTYNPSASNLASPLEYTFVFGVVAPTLTSAQQSTLLNAGVNYIGTGAQGGISNTLIEGGTMMDLNPFNYWYTIDWLSINVAIALSAAVINGSNTPQNPLYYNQAGINTLQKAAQATVNSGIAFGLILSPATVNAVSFVTYTTENPSDYAAGIYKGLSATFVPLRGFSAITIYLTASNIPV